MSYQAKPIDLLIPLNEFPEGINAINSFDESWKEYHSFDGELKLYHYTTNEGLKGILESQSLWCSHIKYFDDPSEWSYGENMVISKIEKLLLKEDDEKIKEMLKTLKLFIKAIGIQLYDIYAACFCKDGNLLSQWRSYSNSGGGYNVGFIFDSDTKITYNLEKTPNLKLAGLRKIIYDENIQNKFIDSVLEKLIDAVHKVKNKKLKPEESLDHTILIQMAMNFANRLAEIIASLKNRIFEKEEEWRLIIFKPCDTEKDSRRQVNFRAKNGELIPYLSTNIYNEDDKKLFPLKSIRIGPKLNVGRAEHSTHLLIKKQVEISTDIKVDTNIEILKAGYSLR